MLAAELSMLDTCSFVNWCISIQKRISNRAHLASGLCMSMAPLRPMPPVSLSQEVKASRTCSRACGSGAARQLARIWRGSGGGGW